MGWTYFNWGSLQRQIVEGKIEWIRERGKIKIRVLSESGAYQLMKEEAYDRVKWRRYRCTCLTNNKKICVSWFPSFNGTWSWLQSICNIEYWDKLVKMGPLLCVFYYLHTVHDKWKKRRSKFWDNKEYSVHRYSSYASRNNIDRSTLKKIILFSVMT